MTTGEDGRRMESQRRRLPYCTLFNSGYRSRVINQDRKSDLRIGIGIGSTNQAAVMAH
jgi:hypothetical protein